LFGGLWSRWLLKQQVMGRPALAGKRGRQISAD